MTYLIDSDFSFDNQAHEDQHLGCALASIEFDEACSASDTDMDCTGYGLAWDCSGLPPAKHALNMASR